MFSVELCLSRVGAYIYLTPAVNGHVAAAPHQLVKRKAQLMLLLLPVHGIGTTSTAGGGMKPLPLAG